MNKPNRKVTATGVAGAIATLIVEFGPQIGLQFSPTAAAALAVVVGFVIGYFVPERPATQERE